MCDILEAYEGYRQEFEAIYGKRGEAGEPDDQPEMLPATDENIKAAFRSMMKAHRGGL